MSFSWMSPCLPSQAGRSWKKRGGSTRASVILTSAYGEETVSALFPGLRVERFIRKPFQLAELVDELQNVLSA